MTGIPAFISKWQKVYPDFQPPPKDDLTMDKYIVRINEYIVDFNLDLQTKFKECGHEELYMMDDTLDMAPEDMSVSSGKTYLHALNGKKLIEDNDDKNKPPENISQLNVLFPFRKMSDKSLYVNQLRLRSDVDVDDFLERSRCITFQGKVSYKDCLQSVAQVGNNLYMMSPLIDVMENGGCFFGNGLAVVNGYDDPYHFPNTLTLFQPSQGEGESSTISEFKQWFNERNHRTLVSLKDTYGNNVSELKCNGIGSYEIELATYSPTNIVLYSQDGMLLKSIGLNPDMYRELRQGLYKETGEYSNGKYVFKNYVNDEEKVKTGVGFRFNLYDTFISGEDRILHVSIPRSVDYNHLKLKFDWMCEFAEGLEGDMEAEILVNEQYAIGEEKEEYVKNKFYPFEFPIDHLAVDSTDIQIVVRIHYQVDFAKRNAEVEYANRLRQSGIVLKDIRLDTGLKDTPIQLTFADYVNDSESERERRLEQFWQVSKYKDNVAYQTILESSIKNVTTSGIEYKNNYSTGDLYGDVFTTKSVLDARYDMNMWLDCWDESHNRWTENEKDGVKMLHAFGRDYIGMGSCSNQLSLFYKQTDVAIGYLDEFIDVNGDNKPDPDQRYIARRENPEPELKYQMVEVVKNINKFESGIKHKSNVFSVVVENSNLAKSSKDEKDMTDKERTLEKYKEQLRNSVTQFVRNVCDGIVPVHTQLFDVQFT